jgi:hypothetical protein
VFGELVAMDEAAHTSRAAEAAAIEKAQGLGRADGSLALPAVGNVRAHCKTFAQKADHGAGALLEIVRLFYGKIKNWSEFQELVKAKCGDFYKVLEVAVPFLQMIRNARDCLEHRNVVGATTYDFTLHADGRIGVPSIEIDFRRSVVERCHLRDRSDVSPLAIGTDCNRGNGEILIAAPPSPAAGFSFAIRGHGPKTARRPGRTSASGPPGAAGTPGFGWTDPKYNIQKNSVMKNRATSNGQRPPGDLQSINVHHCS